MTLTTDPAALRARLSPFQTSSPGRSLFQLTTTGAGYLAALVAAVVALQASVWLTLPFTLLAAGFTVRLFIIQHDCGHGSFFRSARTNAAVGWLCSVATFTPYANWRRQHAGHHAVWNNLDRRENADPFSSCLTVAEYQALSPRRRWQFRTLRHPVVLQLLLPPVLFLILFRLPFDTPRAWPRERRSIWLTNILLAVVLGALTVLLGWRTVLTVEAATMVFASIIGVWLFSVQHRFEESEWSRQSDWSAARASLHGTSYLRLPRVLQWFTGNIGFHHVHHFLPRVPNYRLQACHTALGDQAGPVQTLTLRQALLAPNFALYDEDARRMTPFPRTRPARTSRSTAPGSPRTTPAPGTREKSQSR